MSPASTDRILQRLEREGQQALAEYLPRQRWFGAKGKTITGVQISDFAALPSTITPAVLTIIRVDFNDRSSRKYVLPLIMWSNGATSQGTISDALFTFTESQEVIQIADATAETDACLKLVDGIRERRSWAGQHGIFRGVPTTLADSVLSPPLTQVARLSGEQSNTSILFDRRVILKLIRSVDEGVNPDREILEFLTTHTSYRSVPALIGSIEYEASPDASATDPRVATIGLLQIFIANEGDGWADALRHVKTLLADCSSSRGQTEDERRYWVQQHSKQNIGAMHRLGELTAELHRALMSGTNDTAFRPEPITERDVAAWRSNMTTHIHSLFSQLRTLSSARQANLHLNADQLASLETSCLNALDDLKVLLASPVMKIRVHGDYHLGQILKTGDAFTILDFEGEPARTLDERRAKQCALKDVAGMRRSFHYAGHATRRELHAEKSSDAELTDIWTRLVSEAFWEGYTGVAKPGEAPFLPPTLDEATKVLQIFELDKTVYEIGYELNHRPDWLRIPLEGLQRMFRRKA